MLSLDHDQFGMDQLNLGLLILRLVLGLFLAYHRLRCISTDPTMPRHPTKPT